MTSSKRRQFLRLGARAAAVGACYTAGWSTRSWARDAELPTEDSDAGRSSEDVTVDGPPLERVPGLNAVEVRIGMTGDFSGPSAKISVDALRGALAWLNEINALGGIEGRHVTLLPLDDEGSPRLAVRNLRTFLDAPEVFCLFNLVGTATLGAALPLLRSRRGEDLWLLGELSGAEAARTSPYAEQVFPVRPSHRRELAALVSAMAADGGREIAVLYPLDGHGRSGADAARRAIEAAGLRQVAEAAWRDGASQGRHLDLALRHFRDRGAETVLVVGDGAVAASFIDQAYSGGWRP
ncbi:MAG: ABC transporter substrate-binding protein, partial [Acidobacteriota bacterium]